MTLKEFCELKDREISGKYYSDVPKEDYKCVTDLEKSLNERRYSMGLLPKRVSDVVSTHSFNEKFLALLEAFSLRKFIFAYVIRCGRSIPAIQSLNDIEEIGLAYEKKCNKERKWFVHPMIFNLISIEIDSEEYAKTMVSLLGDIIQCQGRTSESYNRMCTAIRRIESKEKLADAINKTSKAINYIVFNNDEENIRSKATDKELNEIHVLERRISQLIEIKFITDF